MRITDKSAKLSGCFDQLVVVFQPASASSLFLSPRSPLLTDRSICGHIRLVNSKQALWLVVFLLYKGHREERSLLRRTRTGGIKALVSGERCRYRTSLADSSFAEHRLCLALVCVSMCAFALIGGLYLAALLRVAVAAVAPKLQTSSSD